MTDITLTVKGSPDVAQRAAESRGFHVRSLRNHGSDCTMRAEGSLDVAFVWFTEPAPFKRLGRAPGYPAGTLLYYR
jgi:hypothetical protein